ncbi:MAG: lipid A-modifier LpxR family protein [Bacteroidota bacterium]
MKKILLILACSFFAGLAALHAQERSSYSHLFRFYYDNDFINVLGKGTDHQYTGGIRLDYFYTRKNHSNSILHRWMPKAGIEAVNTYGWSLMQMAFTPDDLKKTAPDVDDYPYAGGLFLVHTLHSSNALKKMMLQTELIGGVSGPYSYAAETQEGIHRWIHYQLPMGWNHQMPTDLLLNLNLTAERSLWEAGKWLELNGGGNIRVGTMEDAANIYGLIRVGTMNNYYDGYLSQYGSPRGNKLNRSQIYLSIKPGLSITAYNAFVDGGVFTGRSNYYRTTHNDVMPYTTDKSIHPFADAALVYASGKMSFSLTQKIMPPLLKGFSSHAVGNFSVTVSW